MEDGVQEQREGGGGQKGKEEMSVDNGRWKDHALWKEADAIYQRWKTEEFDINGDKANQIQFSFGVTTGELGKERKLKEETGNLTDIFTNAISNWVSRRELDGDWVYPARSLIGAYNNARAQGCLIAGLAVRRGLQEKDRRIVELDLELKHTKDRFADLDKRFKECGDRVVELETENQKLRERNPMFGVAQGTVDSVAEDATKEEDKK
jgi:hypothetical protein